MTVALPYLVVSWTEVALTVREEEVSLEATVRTPPLVILVFGFVVPWTVQLTDWEGLLVPVTEAVKVWLLPLVIEEVGGETVTEETVGVRPLAIASAAARVLPIWM